MDLGTEAARMRGGMSRGSGRSRAHVSHFLAQFPAALGWHHALVRTSSPLMLRMCQKAPFHRGPIKDRASTLRGALLWATLGARTGNTSPVPQSARSSS
jgi:hypothetical protein